MTPGDLLLLTSRNRVHRYARTGHLPGTAITLCGIIGKTAPDQTGIQYAQRCRQCQQHPDTH